MVVGDPWPLPKDLSLNVAMVLCPTPQKPALHLSLCEPSALTEVYQPG